MSNFVSILGKHLPALASNMLLGATFEGVQDGFMSVDDVVSLVPAPDLSGKADINHNHDSVYAPLVHDHPEFLTQAEIEALPGFGGGSLSGGLCFFRDRKASGVSGGTFTSGAYRVRDITEIIYDTIGVSLASNQLTLPAGVYFWISSSPAYKVNRHSSWLWDCTSDSLLCPGSAEYANSSDSVVSHSSISGVFELEQTSVVEIRHQCESSYSLNGFGVSSTYIDSVYTFGVLLEV